MSGTTKYQVQARDGNDWFPVGSLHTVRLFARENLEGPGGYRDQAREHGVELDFRIVEVTS